MTRALRLRIRSDVIALASCLAAAAPLAGGGASSIGATISPVNATTCGTPYAFTVGAHRVLSGSCAGTLQEHPPTVNVRPGERFSLRITGNANGTRVTRAFPIPKPTGSAVVITAVHGLTVRYQAKTVGRSHLTVRSQYCPTDSKLSTCSALTVLSSTLPARPTACMPSPYRPTARSSQT